MKFIDSDLVSIVMFFQVQRECSCREAIHKYYTRDMDNIGGTEEVEAKRQVVP